VKSILYESVKPGIRLEKDSKNVSKKKKKKETTKDVERRYNLSGKIKNPLSGTQLTIKEGEGQSPK